MFIKLFKSTPSLFPSQQVLRTVSLALLSRMTVLLEASSSGVLAFSTARPRGPALRAQGFLQTRGVSPPSAQQLPVVLLMLVALGSLESPGVSVPTFSAPS